MIKDLLEAILITVLASGLGLTVNNFSPRSLAITDPEGPGALPKPSSRISVKQFGDELKAGNALLLLDVRSVDKWNLGHPLTAEHLYFMEVVEQLPRIQPLIEASDGVVVMCDSEDCPNADGVVKELQMLLKGQKAGNVTMRVLEGGWRAYNSSDLPQEAPLGGTK